MSCALSVDTHWTDACSGAAYSLSCKAGFPAIQELRELWQPEHTAKLSHLEGHKKSLQCYEKKAEKVVNHSNNVALN